MGFLSFLGLGGSKKAAGKLNDSAGEQNDLINSAFDKAEAQLRQFAQQGGAAADLYFDFIGANGPEAQQRAQQTYLESPELQFLQEQGQAGVERSAAARGGLLSGRTLADLSDRSQQVAGLGFNNHLSRLAGAGQQGFQAKTSLANLATGRGDRLANIEAGRGQASANAVLGAQNERVGLTSGIANLASFGLSGGFGGGGFGGASGGGSSQDFRRLF